MKKFMEIMWQSYKEVGLAYDLKQHPSKSGLRIVTWNYLFNGKMFAEVNLKRPEEVNELLYCIKRVFEAMHSKGECRCCVVYRA